MAGMESDSEDDMLAAFEQLEKGGLVASTAHEPPQSFQPVWDGNHIGEASSKVATMELPAVRATAFVDMDTSTATSDSIGSSSQPLELPIFADVAESRGAIGSKRRRIIAKARDPFVHDGEPPAAQADPQRGIR